MLYTQMSTAFLQRVQLTKSRSLRTEVDFEKEACVPTDT